MRNRRKGFTLMEVVVAMLIAVMISTTVATLLSISFNILSTSQGYRTQQVIVNEAYKFLSDKIEVASGVKIIDGEESKEVGTGYKKAYTVKGGRLKVASIGENGTVGNYELLYPEATYRKNSKSTYKVSLTIDVKSKTENEKDGVLDMKLSIFDDTSTAGSPLYSKSSSVRANMLSRSKKQIGPISTTSAPTIYLK